MVIYKHPLTKLSDGIKLNYVRFLHVGIDPNGVPAIWALAENENDDPHDLHVLGTGHPCPDDWVWLGTWVEPPFVWHLFEAPQDMVKP